MAQRLVPINMDNKNNNLPAKVPQSVPTQRTLLHIEKETEVGGVGMGVLSDGTPFLNMRGLARMCGVDHKTISGINAEWADDPPKARVGIIKNLLRQNGVNLENPYVEVIQNGLPAYLYSDVVSIRILEYYAFEAGTNVKEEAKRNFRLLAHQKLREFIFTQVGYDPHKTVPDVWKQFHDRVSLVYNSVPVGYFSVFKEMSDMIVTLGLAGIQINDKIVPDISVGRSWSEYWVTNDFDEVHTARVKYEHEYPQYFPQAKSNPQDAWCYPEMALGEFRYWLRESYIRGGKFEHYLEGKIRQKLLPASVAQLALSAYGVDDPDEEPATPGDRLRGIFETR